MTSKQLAKKLKILCEETKTAGLFIAYFGQDGQWDMFSNLNEIQKTRLAVRLMMEVQNERGIPKRRRSPKKKK